MKKKLVISFLITIAAGLLLAYVYSNLGYTDNTLEMIFSSDKLTNEEKKWLQNKSHLVYASDHDSPPLRFVDEKTGRYTGIVIDYMEALSIELGIEVKVEPEIWQDALDRLEVGDIDMVDMYPSDIRSEKYLFTTPIFYQNAIVVVSNDNTSIKKVKDLSHKTVAAQNGDYVNEYVLREFEGVEIVNTDDYRQAVLLLKAGEVDAVVGDESVIFHFMALYDMAEDHHILQDLLYENKFVLGVPKSEEKLLGILNKGIKALNKRDTLAKIQQKWFGISTSINRANVTEKFIVFLMFAGVLVVVGFVISYSWSRELKRKVDERTQALQTSEKALKTTFNSLTHLMIIIDEDQKIVDANTAFSETLAGKSESYMGKPLSHYFTYTGPIKTHAKFEITYQGLFYELSTYDLGDEQKSMIVMLQDVTEKKINERHLFSANKMAAIGQLAAGVAHEIRNPLGLIRNYTYLLKETKDIEGDMKEKSFGMIEKSVERASNIIDNLLNFSSISGTKISTFNLYDFMDNVIKLHEKTLSETHIKVIMVCSKNLEVTLNIESMKHVLINLISNAVDAIGRHGTITIHCVKTRDRILIEIKDTGGGMSQDQLSQVFNPFYTTKRPGEGTGLGLYIVYSEIEKLGGTIEVYSQQALGTTFRMIF